MKKLAYILPICALLSLPVYAQDVDLEDVTMDIKEQKSNKRAARSEVRDLITDYMLENGDITQEEIDAQAEARAAVRAEIKELREAGDQEALDARLAELREERTAQREEFQAYLDENDELRTAIEEQRQAVRDQREARQAERQERRQERREERRAQREAAEEATETTE